MTTTALRLGLAPAAPAITPDQLALIKRTIAKDATDLELDLFLYDNARRGVHPLDKLIHFTKRSGKYTPVTSIDFMRSRAAMTGDYAGQDDVVFSDGPSAQLTATVTVYRFVHEQRCPFTATARWSEYKPDQNDFMWKKMPNTMLGKCAEALALRKGFPQELSGLYEAAEMDQATRGEVDQATGEIIEVAPRPITAAQRKRLFAIARKAGWSTEAMKAELADRFALTSTEAIPLVQYDAICAAFQESPPAVDASDQPF
jgi:phage recombination protein Bet